MDGRLHFKLILVVFCIIVGLKIFLNEDRILEIMHRNRISFSYGRNTERSRLTFVREEVKSIPMFKEDITFDDVVVFLRTTTQNSDRRLRSLFESWLPDAFKKIKSLFLLSDGDDPMISDRIPDGHFINSKCGKTHSREDLWCKTSKILTIFSETDKKWFCYFDDDMYVNIDNLLNVLRRYDYNGLWYIGRRSETHPHYVPRARYRHVKIWFHNLGAGICFSRGLISQMKPIIRNDGFARFARSIGLFDDLVIGFIINHKLRIPFTENYLFHSQRENMSLIRDLEKQVTLGYQEATNNFLEVDGFGKDEDPYRFRSVHCKIHPDEAMCRILWRRKAVLNVTLTDITHLLIIYLPFLILVLLVFRQTSTREKYRKTKKGMH